MASPLLGRLTKLEAAVGRTLASVQPIEIAGGLQEGVAPIATVNGLHFGRGSAESEQEFRERVIAAAVKARCTPIFGGLPEMGKGG